MEFKIALVQSEQIELVWARVVPHLERVIKYSQGRLGLDEIENALLTNRDQLWIVVSSGEIIAICITQMVIYPNLRNFRVVACGGNHMNLWLADIIERFKAFAKYNN